MKRTRRARAAVRHAGGSDQGRYSTAPPAEIDAAGSGVDHFIPGFGADHAAAGSTTKLGPHYYVHPNANCTLFSFNFLH
ncbi:hypothetical protein ACWCXH_07915 [Kitasatospora sp. NPDC001660]